MSAVDVGILTVIPSELAAAKAALGLGDAHKHKDKDGTNYWSGTIDSEALGRPLRVVLTCIASAGNPATATATSRMLAEHQPRAVILMGIAAGLKHKVRIGEVLLSERVVAYEPAALVRDRHGKETTQRRPDIDGLAHTVLQDVTNYLSAFSPTTRIADIFAAIGGVIPTPPQAQKLEYQAHVVRRIAAPALSTIATGEKLLRNPNVLGKVREAIHGKTEVGEMEAAGFVAACRPGQVPWLIIRGISDFGDEFKNDAFHTLASRAAAAVLLDFLRHGLVLDFERGPAGPGLQAGVRPNPFVVGRAIRDDEDFFGRVRECSALLDYVRQGAAVELLGGPLSGKTSLLYWLERHAYPDRPVVAVDPASGLTPRSFVHAIAKALDRQDVVAALGEDGEPDLIAALRRLVPFVLLLDDADSLATLGEGFNEAFFLGVRSLVQAGQLVWVSASRVSLHDLFEVKGLSSSFLNGSNKVRVGALDRASARALIDRGPAGVDKIVHQAGCSAYALQWFGNHLLRHDVALDEACDAFDDEMTRVFSLWWRALEDVDRELLRRCGSRKMLAGEIATKERSRLRSLKRSGLVREDQDGRFELEGAGWARFVDNAKST